jgi:hypothetical protein
MMPKAAVFIGRYSDSIEARCSNGEPTRFVIFAEISPQEAA